MNESKQAMLELANQLDELRKRGAIFDDEPVIYEDFLVANHDLIVAALRASAPQEDGRALHKPVGTYTDEEAEDNVADAYAALSAPLSVALEAGDEIQRLRDVLLEAKLQIDYLHAKFKPTGTGEATLARIRAALTRPQPGGAVAGTERGTP